MGTRNLTLVIHKGEIRMAQYGQFDGYPTGVGVDIARTLKETTLQDLRKAMEKCSFLTENQLDQREKTYREGAYPLLDRHYSGGTALSLILKMASEKKAIELQDSRDFAADSLFCEWAYVIDLDKKKVEVYEGFNTTPLTKKDRFFYMQKDNIEPAASGDKYYPVRLKRSYSLKGFTVEALAKLEAA